MDWVRRYVEKHANAKCSSSVYHQRHPLCVQCVSKHVNTGWAGATLLRAKLWRKFCSYENAERSQRYDNWICAMLSSNALNFGLNWLLTERMLVRSFHKLQYRRHILISKSSTMFPKFVDGYNQMCQHRSRDQDSVTGRPQQEPILERGS